MANFFISYNETDQSWAEWIAWTLEEADHTVVIQAWDFRPGGNFVVELHAAISESEKTILVLSEAYLKAEFSQAEWASTFASDPRGLQRKVIPVKVQNCQPTGLLSSLICVDLVSLNEEVAEQVLLNALPERLKPTIKPSFPRISIDRKVAVKPDFPPLVDFRLWPPEPMIASEMIEEAVPLFGFRTSLKNFCFALRKLMKQNYKSVLLCMAAAGTIVTLREAGVLQVWELQAFDWMMNHRPAEDPDERIVIIGIDEEDLETYGDVTVTDTLLANLLEVVNEQHPTVIGLDLFRNVPTDVEGYDRLQNIFRETSNIIGIEKVVGDVALPAVSGNSILSEKAQTAASDLMLDVDGHVRRGFIVPNATGRALEGLPFRMALEYLASYDIYPNPDSDILELGHARMPPFESNSGGYQNADAGGYQLIMNWRSKQSFETFSAQDVLTGKISPGALQDKIVFIGSMQSRDADVFFTPYSRVAGEPNLLPSHGIEIHASFASQLISAAFGQRPFIRVWSGYIEKVAIVTFTALGLGLYRLGKSTIFRMRNVVLCVSSTFGISYILLVIGGLWLPVIPLCLALVTAPVLNSLQRIQYLELRSQTDELTQLVNQRSFLKHLDQLWKIAARAKTSIALLLFEIDDFSLYKNAYGDKRAKRCLRQVSQAISQAVNEPGAIAARYGDENIAVLLPNSDVSKADEIAHEASDLVQSLEISHSTSRRLYITVSYSIVTRIPESETNPLTLVRAAEQKLFELRRQYIYSHS